MIRQVFCGFFSNLVVKFWKSRKYFHLTISAVVAASFQTFYLISKKCSKTGKNCYFILGFVSSMYPYFINLDRNSLKAIILCGSVDVFFRDTSFDMIIFILAEILQARFQQIKMLLFFCVASFLHMSQVRVTVPELGISNYKPYRIFK